MRPSLVWAVAAVVAASSLAGCFGKKEDVQPQVIPPPPELDQQQQDRLAILAAPEVRDYKLPGSQVLETVVAWFNDTIGPEANTGYLDRNMDGGNDLNTQLKTFDIADLLPEGQPTALRIELSYFGQPGSAASAHIYACVPGYCSYFTRSNNDQFNWKASIEVKTIMTIGVPGEVPVVGVAYNNGLIANPMPFYLKVTATYFNDVLTPVHAYAFKVPQGATGITLRSVKPGQEHLHAKFLVIDPKDELVSYTVYDDIAIVSESVFIPTRQPGEYVFYAQEMENGFLSITSDAPLGNDTGLRVLPTTETRVADSTGPAPGVPARNFIGEGPLGDDLTPWSPGFSSSFNVDDTFPLEIGVYIDAQAVGAAEIHVLSDAKGLVAETERWLRVDTDMGTLGYTRDEWNTAYHWENLAKGAYTVEIVSDGVVGEVGHWVKTYSRAPAA